MLFSDKNPCDKNSLLQHLPGFSSIRGVKVVERSENVLVIEFSLPPDSPYFDGHFPGFSLLPAVAQMELLIRSASEYFGTGIDIPVMRRIKFTKFIRPDAPMLLHLKKSGKNISFMMLSRDDKSVCSIGTFTVREDIDA